MSTSGYKFPAGKNGKNECTPMAVVAHTRAQDKADRERPSGGGRRRGGGGGGGGGEEEEKSS